MLLGASCVTGTRVPTYNIVVRCSLVHINTPLCTQSLVLLINHITSQHEMKMRRVFINFPFENTWNGSSQWQDRTAVHWELNGCCWWVIGWIRWSMFSGCLKTLLCFVPCRVVSVGGRRLFGGVCRCGLWWRDCSLCCVVSVCLYSSPIILLLFLFFFLFSCGCTLSKTTMFIVQSSPVFVCSFVPCMICLLFALQLSTIHETICSAGIGVDSDRQLSCNGSRSYSSMVWNFLPEYDTCVTSCVCVFSSLLFVSLFQKIHTHTYTVFLFLFQPMHEWMSW